MNSVTERIKQYNQGRDPELLLLKYKLMTQNPFAFLRATCHLFYEDWPAFSPLDEAPPVWICGDLHLQNFGSYRGDNRFVYFGINDFDESALAPCTWDLARLLVSILLAGHILKINKTKNRALCEYVLDVYTKTLRNGRINSIDEDNAVGPAKTLLEQVEKRQRRAFLDKYTTHTEGARDIHIDTTHISPATGAEKAQVTRAIDEWAIKHTNPPFFKVLGVAHRIAGIGSLGVDRYVILIEGKGSPHENHLLDLKADGLSSLEPYLKLPQPLWNSHAERVVSIQRFIQAMPPALLAALEMAHKPYTLRELQPMEDKVDFTSFIGKFRQFEQLGRTVAQVTAWGQFQSGGRQGSAIASELMDFAKTAGWRKILLRYTQKYAEKVVEDYKEFCVAYESGPL